MGCSCSHSVLSHLPSTLPIESKTIARISSNNNVSNSGGLGRTTRPHISVDFVEHQQQNPANAHKVFFPPTPLLIASTPTPNVDTVSTPIPVHSLHQAEEAMERLFSWHDENHYSDDTTEASVNMSETALQIARLIEKSQHDSFRKYYSAEVNELLAGALNELADEAIQIPQIKTAQDILAEVGGFCVLTATDESTITTNDQ